jgi:hypothetical protein
MRRADDFCSRDGVPFSGTQLSVAEAAEIRRARRPPSVEKCAKSVLDTTSASASQLSKQLILLVPEAGLEPASCCQGEVLSLLRLPFRHSGAAGGF